MHSEGSLIVVLCLNKVLCYKQRAARWSARHVTPVKLPEHITSSRLTLSLQMTHLWHHRISPELTSSSNDILVALLSLTFCLLLVGLKERVCVCGCACESVFVWCIWMKEGKNLWRCVSLCVNVWKSLCVCVKECASVCVDKWVYKNECVCVHEYVCEFVWQCVCVCDSV